MSVSSADARFVTGKRPAASTALSVTAASPYGSNRAGVERSGIDDSALPTPFAFRLTVHKSADEHGGLFIKAELQVCAVLGQAGNSSMYWLVS